MIDGFAKEHLPQSRELFDHISKLDFENGDYFCFKRGGDGDNGEVLMDYFDDFFICGEVVKAMEPLEASEAHKKIGYKHDCPRCRCALGFKEKKWAPSRRDGRGGRCCMRCASSTVGSAGRRSTGHT